MPLIVAYWITGFSREGNSVCQFALFRQRVGSFLGYSGGRVVSARHNLISRDNDSFQLDISKKGSLWFHQRHSEARGKSDDFD
jgi:hypothetical protein